MFVVLLTILRNLLIAILLASLILFIFNKPIMKLILIQYFVSPGSKVSATLAGNLVKEMDQNGHLDYDDDHHDLFVTNLALVFTEELNGIIRSESENLSMNILSSPIEKESITQYTINTYFLTAGYYHNSLTNSLVFLVTLQCILLILMRKFASDNTLELNLIKALYLHLNDVNDGCLDDIIRVAKECTDNNTLYVQTDVLQDIYDIIYQNTLEGEVFK